MNRITFFRRLFACFVLVALLLPTLSLAQSKLQEHKLTNPVSESDTAYRYRLFETTNIWTFILLDTAMGLAWQVQFSVNDNSSGKWVINDISLLPENEPLKNGRFTLYQTQNMYNFLLLDRQDSRVWQLQWSMEEKYRGIQRLIE
ncbi:MAG: hypothetical protein HGB35_08525 [Geobacteraceae bacterium]|nr:hypothetical protein [Geobacteraceae bacterium]